MHLKYADGNNEISFDRNCRWLMIDNIILCAELGKYFGYR
jgi:hypothetical protein